MHEKKENFADHDEQFLRLYTLLRAYNQTQTPCSRHPEAFRLDAELRWRCYDENAEFAIQEKVSKR